MGSSVDPAYIARLQDDIRIACQRLEDVGHETLVITVHDSGYDVGGSKIGTDYANHRKVLVSDFYQYCSASKSREKEEKLDDSTEITVESDKTFGEVLHSSIPSNSTTVLTVESDKIVCEVLNTTSNGTTDLFENENDSDDADDYNDTESTSLSPIPQTVSSAGDERVEGISESHASSEELKDSDFKAEPTTGIRRNLRKRKANSSDIEKKMPTAKVVLTRLRDKTKVAEINHVKPKSKNSANTKTEKQQTPVVQKPVTAVKTVAGYLKCSVCNQFLSSEDQVAQHADMHRAFECEHCGKHCRSLEFLQKHKARICERNFFNKKCDQCSEVFQSSLDLKIHIEQAHEKLLQKNKGKFPCSKCESVFNFEQHLNEHNQRIPDCDKVNGEMKSVLTPKDQLDKELTYNDPVTGELKVKTMRELLATAKNGKITCELCQKKLTLKSSYKRHLFSHCPHRICNICTKDMSSKDSFMKHMRRHDERPYYCSTCFNRFETKARLDHHITRYCTRRTNTEDLVCKDCGYQAANLTALKVHRKSRHGDPRKTCETCGKSFAKRSTLRAHVRTMHGDDIFECAHCGKSFSSRSSWKRHIQVHGDVKYKCEMCSYETSSPAYLKSHMSTHTPKYVCHTCGKTFSSKYNLTTHIRIHTGERPYVCDFKDCRKGFRSLDQLQCHKNTHSDTYKYVCDFCGRGFKVRNELSHHRLYHTVEYRWPCDYCEEKFKMLKYFKRHIVKAHPEKAREIESKTKILFYRCSICPKMFSIKEHCFEHENWHTGNKPFICKHCGKGFCSKGNLRQHERSHSVKQFEKCSFCLRKYVDGDMLKKHLKEKHGCSENVRTKKKEISTQNKKVRRSIAKVEEVATLDNDDTVAVTVYYEAEVDDKFAEDKAGIHGISGPSQAETDDSLGDYLAPSEQSANNCSSDKFPFCPPWKHLS